MHCDKYKIGSVIEYFENAWGTGMGRGGLRVTASLHRYFQAFKKGTSGFVGGGKAISIRLTGFYLFL